jgi:hypothetical protein
MRRLWPLIWILGLGLGACAETESETEIESSTASTEASTVDPTLALLDDVGPIDGCNPAAPEWDCFFPFPTDMFLTKDESLPSGYRLEIPDLALPQLKDGGPADPLVENALDGASTYPQILALLPSHVDADNLPTHTDDASKSRDPYGPTLLLDTTTGELISHFAEVQLGFGETGPHLLAIRPLAPLAPQRRYVAAIVGVQNEENDRLFEAPESFRALRDGDSELEALTTYYEAAVFAPLVEAGVSRDDLQLAWAFTTGSDAARLGKLMSIRDKVVNHFSTSAPVVTITDVVDDPAEHIARRIEGTFQVPSFVTDELPGARLVLDTDGMPSAGAPFNVPFVVYIPRSVTDNLETEGPARLLQFGHGFFGSMGETGGFPTDFANEYRFVVMAVEWWGMSNDDRATLVEAISNNIVEAGRFVERTHQGMANALSLGYAARDGFRHLDAFQVDGKTVFDPHHLYFLGVSQGHILGGVFAALSPLSRRIALNAGGAGMGLIMTRSRSFGLFRFLIDQVLASPFETQRMLCLLAALLDPIDPTSWGAYTRNRFDLRVLLQTGIGDTQVPSQSAHVHARTLGIPLLSPSPRAIPGLDTVEPPYQGSALVEFDFGYTPDPTYDWLIPPIETEVHEALRRLPAAMRQMSAFFHPDGHVEGTCDGVCDPE